MFNMKKIISCTVLCLFLVGCSFIPKKHDTALATSYVNLSLIMDEINCDEASSIETAIYSAVWMERYAEFRDDPQIKTVSKIITNLESAVDSSPAACERWINLTNIKMKTLKKVWSKR